MTTEISTDSRRLHLVDKQTEIPKQESAVDILAFFHNYVENDPDKEAVCWNQLYTDPRPSNGMPRIEETTSLKSIRRIDIDGKYALHAEAIVLEEDARTPASYRDIDQHPSMWFRFTLTTPQYDYNPRRNMDPTQVFARIYIDLGEQGAAHVDNSGERKTFDREYYNRGYPLLLTGLSAYEKAHPVLSLFTALDCSQVRGGLEQKSVLTADHMRAIKTAFPPYQVAPAAVPLN